MNSSFEEIRTNLNNLETKILNKIEKDLIKTEIEAPVRSIEHDINQLIGNLNSLSMLNDSEKLLCLKSIDSSINQVENK